MSTMRNCLCNMIIVFFIFLNYSVVLLKLRILWTFSTLQIMNISRLDKFIFIKYIIFTYIIIKIHLYFERCRVTNSYQKIN